MRGCSGVKREAASLRRTVPSRGRASTPLSLLTGNVIPVDESPAMTRSFERRVSTRMHPRDPKPNLGFFSKEGNRGKIFVAARVRNVLRFPQHFATTVRFLGGKSVERGRHPNNSGRLRDMWAPSVGRHPASDNCGRRRWATSNSAADIRQQCAPLASRAPRRARFR